MNYLKIKVSATILLFILIFVSITYGTYADSYIDTGYPKVNDKIKNYIKLFVFEETNQNLADVTLCVGRKCSNFNSLNDFTLKSPFKTQQKFGNISSRIVYNGKDIGKGRPYNGIIGGFWKDTDGKNYIMAYGNDIDGDIAAVKKLISARDLFLNKALLSEDRTKVIDDYDLTGISVADLLRNPSNKPYYNQRGSDAFANVVERILNNNNFEITIKTVKTTNDNTTLRLKNVNTDYSANFKDAIATNSKPVVLSRGIHSNLLTWNDFGKELAFDEKSARDTWLIEMVGGPTIDEDCQPGGTYACPNYTFSDLKTYYWPALITGVQNYSGQKSLDYVGFSLGCSTALESLELYGSNGKANAGYVFDSATGNYLSADLSSNPVDTFVAVACPGNFSRLSSFMELFNYTYNRVFNPLKEANNIHIKDTVVRLNTFAQKDYVRSNKPELYNKIPWFSTYLSTFTGSNRMSLNIYQEFYNWINNISEPMMGQNVNVNNLLVIQGDSNGIFSATDNTDGVVPIEDQKQLCKNINSSNKYYLNFDKSIHFSVPLLHPNSIPDEDRVTSSIKEFINYQQISKNQQYIISKKVNCDPD